MKNLRQSAIDRQNILNNGAFINKIQEHFGFTGLLYNGEYLFTSKMLADFFDITTRTLTNLLKQHETIMSNFRTHSGMIILRETEISCPSVSN